MAKRTSLSKATRFEVFKRDKFTCQYCGRTPPQVMLQVDHIVAVARGGRSEILNLITSCAECNLGKGARDLSSAPPSLVDQIQERREREEQAEEHNRFLLEIYRKTDEAIDDIGRRWFNYFTKRKNRFTFGPERRPSIRTFLKHLTIVDLQEAIEKAHGKIPVERDCDERTWKYFCGICWGVIKERNDRQSKG